MIVPLFFLFASLAGIATVLVFPGLADLLLLAGPCAIASLVLLARAYIGRTKGGEAASAKWILVDGSNVMYWRDDTPSIATVRAVVHHLSALGFTPGVVFDANAGYLTMGKYQHHHAMSKLLGLTEKHVMVVAKGTPADPILLAAARDYRARIVTNDRYRDWADAYPEVRDPGHLIRGGYREGALWLDLGAAQDERHAVPLAASGT